MLEVRRVHLVVALVSGLVFSLSFRLNQYFDDWLIYSPGISLLFIPAGVKLLAVLLGRWPAVVGLLVVGVYLGAGIWPDLSMRPVFYFAFVGLMTYPVAAYGVMKWLHIRADLSNLRYLHIVVLSLAASVFNGVVHNVVYMLEGVSSSDDLWRQSAAMAFGDFMGCFVVVALFHTVAKVIKARHRFTR